MKNKKIQKLKISKRHPICINWLDIESLISYLENTCEDLSISLKETYLVIDIDEDDYAHPEGVYLEYSVEETEFEYKRRLQEIDKNKAFRKKQYLELKKEFENDV